MMEPLTRAQLEQAIDERFQNLFPDGPWKQQVLDTDAAHRTALMAMTDRATQSEAKWHRAATHDSSIDEAEVIHELKQEIARLRVLLGRWSTLYVAGPDVIDPGLMTDTVQALAGTKEGG